jgi:hypothetical protein
MTLPELLADMASRLGAADIPYMVTGSMASSFHGEPRATRDLDIVIDPTPDSLRRLAVALPSEQFYVSREAATEALARHTQFNVIEIATGWKIDFVIRKDRPFSREEFGRRERVKVLGTQAYMASAEDTIIAKLEWARAGDPERQLRDVEGILAVSGDRIDHAYLDRWIHELDLAEMWAHVEPRLHEAAPELPDLTVPLDAIDGAWERAQQGRDEDRGGEGIPLEDL